MRLTIGHCCQQEFMCDTAKRLLCASRGKDARDGALAALSCEMADGPGAASGADDGGGAATAVPAQVRLL